MLLIIEATHLSRPVGSPADLATCVSPLLIGVTQLEVLPSLVAGRQDASVPRQLRNS